MCCQSLTLDYFKRTSGPKDLACMRLDCCKLLHKLYQLSIASTDGGPEPAAGSQQMADCSSQNWSLSSDIQDRPYNIYVIGL